MNKNRRQRILEAATAYGECADCENAKNKAAPAQVIAHGESPSIAIITEAPTGNGRLLSPAAEDMLGDLMEAEGVGWDYFYLFAAFRFPLAYSGKGMAANISYCRARARRILGVIRPKAVLLMGNNAAAFFADGKKAFKIPVASPQKAVYRVPALVTYHPNYYFMSGRNKAVKEAIAGDLRKAIRKAKKNEKR